ncbi:efflux RND transporter periplasmic adaptor subunit [Gayadomonas joobiniege]|uniref:efflux RND transporter periplasmic adaptor subunit n=1 Tax=Gayadomonas joobiniege TaxID=1234606 RepID=UPI000363B997|nr:efflux RND transporter periplasmic adaptor subunit [Gayadomonas joobiniege]
MPNKIAILLWVTLGGLIGAGLVGSFVTEKSSEKSVVENHKTQEPLYWVAPMDDNYRRDKPGKSPMGMDLIPVYKNEPEHNKAEQGIINIAPHVVNNLGVRTASVKWALMDSEINTIGFLQSDQDNLVHMHPRVSGWIEKLYVQAVGDPVKKGQAVYTLYSPQLVNAQEELLIALKRENSALIQAAENRLTALKLPDSVIQNLKKSKQIKQEITFYAPQAGVVNQLNIREGFYVEPGNTLLSIANLEQVWLEAEVFARDAALIQTGLPIEMKLDYFPNQKWLGKIDYIYPDLNLKNRTLRIRAKFANKNLQLKPNMFARVRIKTQANEKKLLVPTEAVIRTGMQDRVVLALGNGQFKSVAVTLGQINPTYTEILSGLAVNDLVVTSAQFLLDSESSKDLAFQRISVDSNLAHSVHDSRLQTEQTSNYPSATVLGRINQVDKKTRVFNISREAIKKWHRAAATMDFIAADQIAIDEFQVGDEVRFTFIVKDDLVITQMQRQGETK